MKRSIVLLCCCLLVCRGFAQKNNFRIVERADQKKLEVYIGNQLFTALLYADSLKKHALYPIYADGNLAITRGWPFAPLPGDKVDHPHQFGLWLNYGDVNGADYWNNSTSIDTNAKAYGYIRIKNTPVHRESADSATIRVEGTWYNPGGKATLEETTTYVFRTVNNLRIIDRITTLKALQEVLFKDSKEGLFGLRVARQLEQPATKAERTYIEGGAIKSLLDNTGVTGRYRSSEGKEGDNVFGTRAKWVTLTGAIQGRPVTIAMLDHPGNINYPTYWMARGYGLFAANPLGAAIYTEGKEHLNFKLAKGGQVTFKYRVVTGPEITPAQLETLSQSFTRR